MGEQMGKRSFTLPNKCEAKCNQFGHDFGNLWYPGECVYPDDPGMQIYQKCTFLNCTLDPFNDRSMCLHGQVFVDECAMDCAILAEAAKEDGTYFDRSQAVPGQCTNPCMYGNPCSEGRDCIPDAPGGCMEGDECPGYLCAEPSCNCDEDKDWENDEDDFVLESWLEPVCS